MAAITITMSASTYKRQSRTPNSLKDAHSAVTHAKFQDNMASRQGRSEKGIATNTPSGIPSSRLRRRFIVTSPHEKILPTLLVQATPSLATDFSRHKSFRKDFSVNARRKLISCAIVCLLMMGLAAQSSLACTGIRLTATDGSVIRGRTLEFGTDLNSDVLMIPRGFARVGNTPDGKPGLSWKAKYASLGANAERLYGAGRRKRRASRAWRRLAGL